MKILLVHNSYRSTAPSGENRVVDQESEALAALGHDVGSSNGTVTRSRTGRRWQKATLPARVVWNPASKRDLGAVLRRVPAGRRPRPQHVPAAESRPCCTRAGTPAYRS